MRAEFLIPPLVVRRAAAPRTSLGLGLPVPPGVRAEAVRRHTMTPGRQSHVRLESQKRFISAAPRGRLDLCRPPQIRVLYLAGRDTAYSLPRAARAAPVTPFRVSRIVDAADTSGPIIGREKIVEGRGDLPTTTVRIPFCCGNTTQRRCVCWLAVAFSFIFLFYLWQRP